MKSNRMVWLMIISLIVMLGCQTPRQGSAIKEIPNKAVADSRVSRVMPEWVRRFEFEELVRYSDLIIEGEIVKVVESRGERSINDPLAPPSIIYTDYVVSIQKVLKSDVNFAKDSILIVQQGGSWEGFTHILDGDEPFQLGERAFLFLTDASDDPHRTYEGQIKYAVMLPGGRFTVNSDDTLDTPMKDLAVADKYRGKSKIVLIEDVIKTLPSQDDQIRNLYPAFLVAEGVVQKQESRLFQDDDDKLVSTIYDFQLERVIHDDLEYRNDMPHKFGIYTKSPVKKGDVIKIYENGGTYGDITQRHAWSQGMEPGARMLLFLGGSDCRNTLIHICTQEEKNGAQAMYTLGLRFIVEPDGTLQGVGRSYLSRFYNAKTLETIEIDFANALRRWEQESQRMTQPDPAIPTPRPPPLPTPES